ncbi:unnamed protein product [Vitrella brassicaformis CCMP3155]|uniref:Fe2OG dioxygenase domain-containing protein n=1 Tax=Vitrella brassicaformis (strain CCMP3155) TaxID=1169540 RepID=A0A0G4GGT2_VITBC|nr:unnamed protein product [Vitrella brassicaformis CCMP3155]|eukprot:CEM28828.1 unnamed protein product [Vitrella brassicaformis CCMP3155]
MTAKVPVIDLLLPEEEVVKAIRKGCEEIGFLCIINHGVDPAVVAGAFKAMHDFFTLPLETKMKSKGTPAGYMPLQAQTLDPENQTEPDQKEGYGMVEEVPAGHDPNEFPFHGKRVYPDDSDVPGWREAVMGYYGAVRSLAMRMLRYIALAMEVPDADAFIAKNFEFPIFHMRMLRYEPRASNPAEGRLAAGAHTDWGLITLLKTDGGEGLQVQPRNSSEWLDVEEPANAFVVNLGDLQQRWTNDVFTSRPHRVMLKSDKVRYSIAYFCDADERALVECLPSFQSPSRPPRYSPITQAAYLAAKYEQTIKKEFNVVSASVERVEESAVV